jgi:hypothetical protein
MKFEKTNLNEKSVNEGLQSLVRSTLVPGSVSYAYDRRGDYSLFACAQGNRFEVFTASNDYSILGSTQITYDQVYWNGTKTEIAYSGDTRIDPSARGLRLSDRLIKMACALPVPVLGAVLQSNRVVLEKKLADWKKLGVDFCIVGELKVFLCLAVKRRSKTLSQTRVATESDLPKMFELWKSEQSQKNLGRAYENLTQFANSYVKTNGVTLDQTLVVEDASRNIVGFVSLWNQSKIRTIRIAKFSWSARVFSQALRLFISLPKTGEELKILYAFQFCLSSRYPEAAKAMNALIREARTRAADAGFLFFSIGLDERDPLIQVMRKHSLVSNSVRMICANGSPDGRLFHLEVGLG